MQGFVKETGERSLNEVSKKNERSLSEVLKQSDFCKAEKIIRFIEENGEITPKDAEVVSGKSPATARRYLKMLVGTGYIEAVGNTNNSMYRIRK